MHILKGIFSGFAFFALVAAILLGGAWISELIRRRRWDRAGFADFLRAGAPLDHAEFLDAFKKSFTKEDVSFSVYQGESVRFASGTFAAVDPAYAEDAEPFEQTVPPGNYPIELLIGRRSDGDQRCCAVRVRFSDSVESRLEPAWTKQWHSKALKTRQLPGFGVDSATAGVFAAEILPSVASWTRRVYGEMTEVNPYLSNRPQDLWIYLRDNESVQGVAVNSGLGDGFYQCFFAFDAERKPVAFYIDFGFFNEPQWHWPTKP